MAKHNNNLPDTLFSVLEKTCNGNLIVDVFSLNSLMGVEVFTIGSRVSVMSMDKYLRYVARIQREGLIGNLLGFETKPMRRI